MATITLQTSLSGPTESSGTCKVLYEVTNADGIDPAIFVVMHCPPPYTGADGRELWQHVAYADEMTTLATNIENNNRAQLIRKATVIVPYQTLEAAQNAITSIREQIQRLVNEINTLATYETTNTYIISSTN